MFFKSAAMRLTAGILALSTMAAPVLAVGGVINTGSSNLNLRSEADASSAVVTKIPGGSTVEVLDTAPDGWYQVSFSGMNGYVSSQYVDLTRESVSLRGRVESALNVRRFPSTTADKCGTLYGGQTVTITEKLDGWYRISEGYVNAEYVTVLGSVEQAPAAQAPVVQTPVAEAVPVEQSPAYAVPAEVWQTAPSAETLAQLEALTASEAPTEEAPAAPAAETAEVLTGRVITGSLNIRSAPSTDSDKCGKLSAGKNVEILEVLDGWYRIAEGYVSADYVLVLDGDEAAASDIAAQAVELGLSLVGSRYVYGGSSPKGFDCSGFTSYIYKQFGITLNRSSSGQLDNGTPVSMSELLPGDLVIFKKGRSSARASHVGLYIGDGQFVHSSTYGVGVIVSHLSESYYTTGFVGGRRVV